MHIKYRCLIPDMIWKSHLCYVLCSCMFTICDNWCMRLTQPLSIKLNEEEKKKKQRETIH